MGGRSPPGATRYVAKHCGCLLVQVWRFRTRGPRPSVSLEPARLRTPPTTPPSAILLRCRTTTVVAGHRVTTRPETVLSHSNLRTGLNSWELNRSDLAELRGSGVGPGGRGRPPGGSALSDGVGVSGGAACARDAGCGFVCHSWSGGGGEQSERSGHVVDVPAVGEPWQG